LCDPSFSPNRHRRFAARDSIWSSSARNSTVTNDSRELSVWLLSCIYAGNSVALHISHREPLEPNVIVLIGSAWEPVG